jgi:2-oxoglutarate dehydrogenase E2 component (dihydrolipoamide succinyltransferase)
MPIDLKVPEMGESVTEIYVGQWRKSEGDEVDQDEPLVELESEKATLDLRAPKAGILAEILKRSGETAEVGEIIGRMSDGGKQRQPQVADEAPAADKREQDKAEPPAIRKEADDVTERVEQNASPPREKQRPEGKQTVEEPGGKEAGGRAEENSEQPPDQQIAREIETPAAPSTREERVLMSPIRRRIAMRLVEAQQNAALLTTFNEIDMTAVKELRATTGEAFERRYHRRLGFMSFFVKATIEALRHCPGLNATIDGNEIVYRRYYDIGVAISSDRGLVVPVLRNADEMSFAEIEGAIDGFASRARDGQLKVDELQGGTFTITNGGVFGSLLSTPIVNPPQSGVLGMHTIQSRPIAIGEQVVIRPMMYVALTYDHRLVDGREAVSFLRRIKETIEQPARLLIEV